MAVHGKGGEGRGARRRGGGRRAWQEGGSEKKRKTRERRCHLKKGKETAARKGMRQGLGLREQNEAGTTKESADTTHRGRGVNRERFTTKGGTGKNYYFKS